MNVSLLLPLHLIQQLIGLDGGLGEAVVLPPRHQRGHGGDASRDQLLHGLALDGQHRLAEGAQHLIGQCQQQAGGAGNGACGDGGCIVGMCGHGFVLSPGDAGLVCQSRMGSALARLYSSVPVPLPPSLW